MSVRLPRDGGISRVSDVLRLYVRTYATSSESSKAARTRIIGWSARLDIGRQPSTILPIESPDHTRSRHLLRAILRECTYLPDSHARTYLRRYAVARFRDYACEPWQHPVDSETADRLAAKQRDAQSALNKLRRAVEGELQPLRALLLLAYGRTGRRRRELVAQLVHAKDGFEAEALDHAGDTVEIEDKNVDRPAKQSLLPGSVPATKNAACSATAPPHNPYMPAISSPLRALMESQIKYPLARSIRPTLRRMNPIIPELNAWLRPLPQVRLKNLTRAWYASFLNKANPPLPAPEWERLYDLATGRRKEVLPRRRKRGQSARMSALDMQLRSSRIDSARAFPNRQARTVTSRSMRRLWMQVFEQCPRLDWSPAQQEWKVIWGSHALHSLQYKTSLPWTGGFANEATTG